MEVTYVGTVTREVANIHYAHFALESYAKGTPCTNLHGHSGRAVVSVVGSTADSPFIVEFGTLKRFIQDVTDRWDHSLLVHWSQDEWDNLWGDFSEATQATLEMFGITHDRIVALGQFTTAENLARYLAIEVFKKLLMSGHTNIESVTAEFFESSTSSAQVTIFPRRATGGENAPLSNPDSVGLPAASAS